MDGVDYSKKSTPTAYKCGKCGATGIKLWREYQTMMPGLLCCECAAAEEGKDISDIDEKGRYTGSMGDKSDQIGWYVPAVPDEQGVGYWGYTSVPDAGCKWWDRLPTRKPKPDKIVCTHCQSPNPPAQCLCTQCGAALPV